MIEMSGIGWQLFSRAFGNYSFFETTYVCVLNPSAYYSFVMTYACFYIYVLIVKVFGRTYVVQRALSVKAPKNKKERRKETFPVLSSPHACCKLVEVCLTCRTRLHGQL
jgi:hypothetical protein